MRHPRLVAVLGLCLATAHLPAQLGGTYLVGPGGNYANLAAAIAALNSVGVAARSPSW